MIRISAATITLLFVLAFTSTAVGPNCGNTAILDHQLPLEHHETEFKYPKASGNITGSWQLRSQEGNWPPIPGESTKKNNLWISRQSVCGDCICAALDFGAFFGLWRPGRYEARWIATDGNILIGPITLVLEDPKGIDSEVYKKLLLPRIEGKGHPTEQNTLLYGGQVLPGNPPIVDRLLCTYPTSTYAAYVLAKKMPEYSDPLCHYPSPAESLRACREEGKTVVAFAEKGTEEYFQQLDAHMKGGKVPESLRVVLYAYYGELLIMRGRFAEAETAFREAVKNRPSDRKGEASFIRAQDFLAALENKPASTAAPAKP